MLTVKQYDGQYGNKEDVGSIIHVNLYSPDQTNNKESTNKEPTNKQPTNNKEIIILIDISGSMEETIKNVQASLFSFRDSLINKTSYEIEQMDPMERDNILRDTIKLRLITFSNDAKEVWSNESTSTFEDVVSNLRTEAMTNMGDALKLAFGKINSTIFTWIIVMTDGESNEGPCRTSSSFQKLVTVTKPINTKIVTLGYGDRFDPEVLNVVGSFVYLENTEMIPVVLSNLSEEIITAVGFNCTINLNTIKVDETITLNDVIDQDYISGEIIVGDEYIGPICPNVSYDYVFLIGSNPINSLIVEYTDIETGNSIVMDYVLPNTNLINKPPPSNIKSLYYNSLKNKLSYKLYKAIQNCGRRLILEEVNMVQKIINNWLVSESTLPKDILTKMITDIRKNKDNRMSVLLNDAIDNRYSQYRQNSTAILKSTERYMMSPLLN